jgi:hypothetical protein
VASYPFLWSLVAKLLLRDLSAEALASRTLGAKDVHGS